MKKIRETPLLTFRIQNRKKIYGLPRSPTSSKEVLWEGKDKQQLLDQLIAFRRSTGLGRWIIAQQLYERSCWSNKQQPSYTFWKRVKRFQGLKNPLNPIKDRTKVKIPLKYSVTLPFRTHRIRMENDSGCKCCNPPQRAQMWKSLSFLCKNCIAVPAGGNECNGHFLQYMKSPEYQICENCHDYLQKQLSNIPSREGEK